MALLSNDCRFALEIKIYEACTDYLKNSSSYAPCYCSPRVADYCTPATSVERIDEPVPSIWKVIDDVFKASIITYLRAYNASATHGVARLPAEVVCHIFSYLPFADRISVTHVCQHWREVSLVSPAQLWSSVEVRTERGGVLSALLARTHFVPLQRLTIQLHPGTLSEVTSLLPRYLSKVRALHLYAASNLSSKQVQDVINTTLCSRAPLLESFVFAVVSDNDCDIELPDNLFAGRAPLLRNLKLSLGDVTSSLGSASLARITRFTCMPVITVWPEDVQNAFVRLRRLESFTLYVADWNVARTTLSPRAPFAPPRTLRTMVVALLDGCTANPVEIFAYLVHDSIPDIIVIWEFVPQEEEAVATVNLLSRSMPTSLFISFLLTGPNYAFNGAMHIATRDARGSTRIYQNVPARTASLAAHTFSAVAALEIGEASWLFGVPLPTLPALTALVVLTLPLHFGVSGSLACGYAPRYCAESVLACPSLRSVTFRQLSCASATRISAEAVTFFLRAALQYSAPQLERLAFDGVELWGTFPEELVGLHAVALEFNFPTLPPSTDERIPPWPPIDELLAWD